VAPNQYPAPVPVDAYGQPQGGQYAYPPPQQYAQPVSPAGQQYAYPQPQPYVQPGTGYQSPVHPDAVAVSVSPHNHGGKKHTVHTDYNDVSNRPSGAGYGAFMDKHIRAGFIRKVYGILTVQLLVTFGITCIFVFSNSVKQYVQTHAGVYYAALGLNFAFMIAMACCRNTTKVVPYNYILLFAFTLTESYLVGTISSFYDTNTVLIALGITIGVTVALTIFACQ
jgi:protein lifeguard